ncbi:MAG: LacI family DNA-binding transcriptional regulator [Lentisphaeria bacterium]
MSRRVTIKDVALEAGVSVGLVSRVLNGGHCGPPLCDRIVRTVKRLNYVPDPYARAVRSGLKGCLGILVSSGSRQNSFWLEDLLVNLLEAVSAASFRSILQFIEISDPLPGCRKISQFVDGLVLIGHLGEEFPEYLRDYCHVPAITYWEDLQYDKGLSLEVDVADGMRQMAEHLYKHGHREVGVVGADYRMNQQESDAFLHYFRQFVPDYSAERIIRSGDPFSFGEAGYHRTLQMLDRFPRTSALLYLSDSLAFGGINALHSRRLRVPDEISVGSFDNSFWASSYMPALTSLGFNYSVLAGTLVGCLLDQIGGKTPDTSQPLQVHFFQRNSVQSLH